MEWTRTIKIHVSPFKVGCKRTTKPSVNHFTAFLYIRLLLLSAGRRSWSPSGQTSVCPQRRRTTGLLSEAFWTHHPAPARSPLVACSRADTVPHLCTDHMRSSATATLIVPPVRRSTLGDRSFCRRSTGMEQSAVSRTGRIVAHHLLMRTENISFSLEFSGPLVANSLSPPMLYAHTLLTE